MSTNHSSIPQNNVRTLKIGAVKVLNPEGQRAAIAAELATMRQGARTDLKPSAALRKAKRTWPCCVTSV